VAVPHAQPRTRPHEQALLAVALLVARNAPEEEVFAAASEQVAAATGASAGSVLRYVGEERAVAVGAWREDASRGVPVNAELDFNRRNSALGRVRATRLPARADSYEGARGQLPALMRAVGLRSTVAAPIVVGEDAWGAIVASTTREEPLPPSSEQRLVDFAELVARALANAAERQRLEAARVRLVEAADASRRRLERRLHEGAHQHLLALTLALRAARAHAGPELTALLDAALADAEATTTALQDLSRALNPVVLDERGLAPALLALTARAPVPVHLHELPGRRFPAAVETTAHMLVAEALADAAAHGAEHVDVRIADDGDRLLVEVSDDGDGEGRPGPGVRELADRCDALGGGLEAAAGLARATLPL
jgi:signal transduction histidine kinase